MNIEIKTELRPCLVNGDRAFFHRWAENKLNVPKNPLNEGGIKTDIWGLCEFEDGNLRLMDFRTIQFLDTRDKMSEMIWEREEPR